MNRAAAVALLAALLGTVALPTNGADPDVLPAQAAALFGAIAPIDRELTPAETLGRQLFFDARTAADGKTACGSRRTPAAKRPPGTPPRFLISPDNSPSAGGRNVAKTAPHFHDGSVADLPRAVAVMAEVQLGRTLAPAEISAIVSFLESLTGTVPAHFTPPAPLASNDSSD